MIWVMAQVWARMNTLRRGSKVVKQDQACTEVVSKIEAEEHRCDFCTDGSARKTSHGKHT
jgi:hypothetical protein